MHELAILHDSGGHAGDPVFLRIGRVDGIDVGEGHARTLKQKTSRLKHGPAPFLPRLHGNVAAWEEHEKRRPRPPRAIRARPTRRYWPFSLPASAFNRPTLSGA